MVRNQLYMESPAYTICPEIVNLTQKAMSPLSNKERERYARQMMLPQLGEEGQIKLKQASVLCVGAGGLGSSLLYYLAAAGVGKLGIIDDDVVSESNLQRQILHAEADLGENKAENARKRLQNLNPDLEAEIITQRLSDENANEFIRGYDLVVDACDNFKTRFIINRACITNAVPMLYGAVAGFNGQISLFHPTAGGPCYRCMFSEDNLVQDSSSPIGVIGSAPGVIGSMQSAEVIKWILNIGEPLTGKILSLDLLNSKSSIIRIKKNPHCPDCSHIGSL